MPVLHKIKRYEDPELDRQIEELLRNLAPLQGEGPPVATTPRFLGDVYHDVNPGGGVYVANGFTSADWRGVGDLPPPPPNDDKYYLLRNGAWEELIIS